MTNNTTLEELRKFTKTYSDSYFKNDRVCSYRLYYGIMISRLTREISKKSVDYLLSKFEISLDTISPIFFAEKVWSFIYLYSIFLKDDYLAHEKVYELIDICEDTFLSECLLEFDKYIRFDSMGPMEKLHYHLSDLPVNNIEEIKSDLKEVDIDPESVLQNINFKISNYIKNNLD